MITFVKSKLTDATKSLDFKKEAVRNTYPMATQNAAFKKNNLGEWVTGYNIPYGEDEEKILKDTKHPLNKLIVEKKELEKRLKTETDKDIKEYIQYLLSPNISKKLDRNEFQTENKKSK